MIPKSYIDIDNPGTFSSFYSKFHPVWLTPPIGVRIQIYVRGHHSSNILNGEKIENKNMELEMMITVPLKYKLLWWNWLETVNTV